jgi:hypothetical protein
LLVWRRELSFTWIYPIFLTYNTNVSIISDTSITEVS